MYAPYNLKSRPTGNEHIHYRMFSSMTKYLSSTLFSDCSVNDYINTLSLGYGACLFNMPAMRMSICGNSILEESEECDCGPPDECIKRNPCCDPMTCKFIKHAECSTGACCKNCKLLSSDHLCRISKGECDIPEFCDGIEGECPADVFKKNGAICARGLGYCFQGDCPVLKTQCQDIWGQEATHANVACFDRLNIHGTPNGNCGFDKRGDFRKCASKNSYCGSLQCSGGENYPALKEILPIKFVVNKMNVDGIIYECKARELTANDTRYSLVKDGTKCGFQRLCLNQRCIDIKSIVPGKCPLEEVQTTCSGHGVCTNINTCFCDEGWKGNDCSLEDEDFKRDSKHNANEKEKPQYGENEMDFNPNLAFTVVAVAVFVGLCLLIFVVLFLFARNLAGRKQIRE